MPKKTYLAFLFFLFFFRSVIADVSFFRKQYSNLFSPSPYKPYFTADKSLYSFSLDYVSRIGFFAFSTMLKTIAGDYGVLLGLNKIDTDFDISYIRVFRSVEFFDDFYFYLSTLYLTGNEIFYLTSGIGFLSNRFGYILSYVDKSFLYEGYLRLKINNSLFFMPFYSVYLFLDRVPYTVFGFSFGVRQFFITVDFPPYKQNEFFGYLFGFQAFFKLSQSLSIYSRFVEINPSSTDIHLGINYNFGSRYKALGKADFYIRKTTSYKYGICIKPNVIILEKPEYIEVVLSSSGEIITKKRLYTTKLLPFFSIRKVLKSLLYGKYVHYIPDLVCLYRQSFAHIPTGGYSISFRAKRKKGFIEANKTFIYDNKKPVIKVSLNKNYIYKDKNFPIVIESNVIASADYYEVYLLNLSNIKKIFLYRGRDIPSKLIIDTNIIKAKGIKEGLYNLIIIAKKYNGYSFYYSKELLLYPSLDGVFYVEEVRDIGSNKAGADKGNVYDELVSLRIFASIRAKLIYKGRVIGECFGSCKITLKKEANSFLYLKIRNFKIPIYFFQARECKSFSFDVLYSEFTPDFDGWNDVLILLLDLDCKGWDIRRYGFSVYNSYGEVVDSFTFDGIPPNMIYYAPMKQKGFFSYKEHKIVFWIETNKGKKIYKSRKINVGFLARYDENTGAIIFTLTDILFDKKNRLSNYGKKVLFRLLEYINRFLFYGDYHIEVRVHTDTLGDELKNLEKSEKMALQVVNFMKMYGVRDMSFRGYGEIYPIYEDTHNEKNRSKNRRVEIVLIPKQ